jgi:drug/metabolite transporter (DMT)-like permease
VTQDVSPTPQQLTKGIFFGLIAAVVWGAWPVISALGVRQSLGANDLTFLRFTVSGLILLPLFYKLRFQGVNLGKGLVLACGAGLGYISLCLYGLSFAPASHFGIITPSCMLTFTTLGSWLLLKERLSTSRILGFAIIILGVLTIGWSSFASGISDPNYPESWKGDIIFVFCGSLWALYTLSSRIWQVEAFHATTLVSVLSMIIYAPIYFLLTEPAILDAPVTEVLFQGTMQGIFTAVLALLFFSKSVNLIGASKGAVFGALVPAIALLLSIPVLNEWPSAVEILGVIVVSTGMFFALGLIKWKV